MLGVTKGDNESVTFQTCSKCIQQIRDFIKFLIAKACERTEHSQVVSVDDVRMLSRCGLRFMSPEEREK
jgi:hypothetical protein